MAPSHRAVSGSGACPACSGLGTVDYFEPALLAPNKGLSLADGAILPWKSERALARYSKQLENLGARHGFTLATKLADFTPEALQALYYGDAAFGWAGVVQGWLTLLWALVLLVFFDIKSRREEAWLLARFPAYADYQRRVRKLLPFIY